MSDPLTRLGSLGAGASPDIDAIKLRAHRIQRRRRTGLASAGAAAMAVIAVVGVLLTTTGPGADKATQTLAEDLRESAAPSPAAQAYSPLTVPDSVSAGKAAGGS